MAASNNVFNSGAGANAGSLIPASWDGLASDTFLDDRAPTVLLLESLDVNRRVLRSMLRDEGYRLLEASQASEAFALLQTESIDLIMLDLVMPGVSGLDFCRTVKQNRETRFIGVVIMTSIQGVESEIAGIASGADEFLVKPLHPAIVRTRIRAMLRHKRAIDTLDEAESILFALARAVEYRDGNTSGHCHRLATLSVNLGQALGLPRSQILALHRGGYLHDIGKVGIPDAVLFKPGRLNAEEWAIMRTHAAKGEEICRPAKSLIPVLPIIRHHHERWDGTGYPDRLSGEDIPLLARILQVTDVFDALTSARPYKPAVPVADALDILREESRKGWRDPRVIEAFLDSLPRQNGSPMMPTPQETAVERSLENMRNAIARENEPLKS